MSFAGFLEEINRGISSFTDLRWIPECIPAGLPLQLCLFSSPQLLYYTGILADGTSRIRKQPKQALWNGLIQLVWMVSFSHVPSSSITKPAHHFWFQPLYRRSQVFVWRTSIRLPFSRDSTRTVTGRKIARCTPIQCKTAEWHHTHFRSYGGTMK